MCRDHAGGNEEFLKLQPGMQLQLLHAPPADMQTSHVQHAGTTVIGGVNDKVAACTQTVKDQEEIKLGGISIKCIETPL